MLEEKKKRAEFLGSALKISINGSQISLRTSEISLVFSVTLSSGLRPTPVFSSTIFAKNPRKPDGTSHRAFLITLKL